MHQSVCSLEFVAQVGYAIAEHLCENYELAWKCIDNYENSFKEHAVCRPSREALKFTPACFDGVPALAVKEQDTTAASDYENSELHLYKARVLAFRRTKTNVSASMGGIHHGRSWVVQGRHVPVGDVTAFSTFTVSLIGVVELLERERGQDCRQASFSDVWGFGETNLV